MLHCVFNLARSARKAIPDIVFSYLTPARFGRYSSSNLCLADPAWDGVAPERLAEESRLVNPAEYCRWTSGVREL